MRPAVAVAVSAFLVVLFGIYLELRRIDVQLATIAAPIEAFAAAGRASLAAHPNETREERLHREALELRQVADDAAEKWRLMLAEPSRTSGATPRPPQAPGKKADPRSDPQAR